MSWLSSRLNWASWFLNGIWARASLSHLIQLGGADLDGVIGDVLPRQEGADGVGEAVVVHGAVLLIPCSHWLASKKCSPRT